MNNEEFKAKLAKLLRKASQDNIYSSINDVRILQSGSASYRDAYDSVLSFIGHHRNH